MLTVATLLWDANHHSHDFSRGYDERWVEKLYRGFARNLTVPFQFRVWVDRMRNFQESAIKQSLLPQAIPDYSACIEPFCIEQPMIVVGLDTVIVGNIDHLAGYVLTEGNPIALPRDPYSLSQACNGVVLCPPGCAREVFWSWDRKRNDMEHLRSRPHVFIDDLWPGDVISWKGHARGESKLGLHDPEKASIVYFHGHPKPSDLLRQNYRWVKDHWK